jgi:phage shock protein PspC (stress-responsive transcriptional regulator)
MTLSDELSKLRDLHQGGALTDEEYARAKARLLDSLPATAMGGAGGADGPPALAALSALRRSQGDRWVGGICGGIARATGVDSWIVRLAFAVLMLFGGAGLVIYALLWIFVPAE